MLNRHPDVAIPLESLFMIDYLRAGEWMSASELYPMLLREPELREWGLDPSKGDLIGCHTIVDAIERLHQKYAEIRGKPRWGQKTPRFVRFLPQLAQSFPLARFIHVIRDPRAVVNSLKRSDVHHSNALFGARRWRADVAQGLAFEQAAADRVLRVAYEELVRWPSAVLERVCAFLELDWPEADWWRSTDRPTREYSEFYDQIHQNLDHAVSGDSVDRWRHELSAAEIEVVEASARDLMGTLGYAPLSSKPAPSWLFGAWLRLERLAGLGRQTLKYLRQRRGYLFFLFYRKLRLGLLLDFLQSANY